MTPLALVPLLAAAVLPLAALAQEGHDHSHGGSPILPGVKTSPEPTAVRTTELVPGAPTAKPQIRNPYAGNMQALREGQRFYDWFNCSGCHSHGGGGMGPPLMDDQWIYGSDPANVFASIVEGRPNGMPAFGTKLAEEQIWKLVAYVRSLSGLAPRLPEGAYSLPLQNYSSENLESAPPELRRYLKEELGE